MAFFSQLLTWIWIAFQVILIFNAAIFIHELGHFLAAKWRGLRVDRFQVWFGKPIWKKTINGVQYGLGWIPAGGFVMIPQMVNPAMLEGMLDGPPPPAAKPLDKIIVAFAGPLFSLLFAVALSFGVWKIGYPSNDSPPVIGFVVEGQPAQKAGFQVGDRILAIDGEPVDSFFGGSNSVIMRTALSHGEKITYLVQRGDQQVTITSDFVQDAATMLKRSSPRRVGIGPAQEFVIDKIEDNPAASELPLRLQPGDRIISFNGKLAAHFAVLADHDEPVEGTLVFERDGVQKEILLRIPGSPRGEKLPAPPADAAIQFPKTFQSPDPITKKPEPMDQIVDSGMTIFKTFRALFAGSVGANQLSGPVGIATVYSTLLSEPEGWKLALWFSVILNVNLALMNLLPFPILDGGHIVMSAFEWIRRRPMNEKILEWLQRIFFMFLFGFFLYVTWYDVAALKDPDSQPFYWEILPKETTTAPTPAPTTDSSVAP